MEFRHAAHRRFGGLNRQTPEVDLIQFRGHFPKGGYDVHDGRYSEDETTALGSIPSQAASARRRIRGFQGGMSMNEGS